MVDYTYIWQLPEWPSLQYQEDKLSHLLDKAFLCQSKLLGETKLLNFGIDQQAQMDALIQNAIQTSQIEGEDLNLGSVRSSVAKQLGMGNAGIDARAATVQTDHLVAMLCNATSDLDTPIAIKTLCQWQAALFPAPSVYKEIRIGSLRSESTMQVVSHLNGREVVHYEAPPRSDLDTQLDQFIEWFNSPREKAKDEKQQYRQAIIRAALAHLWLITIHPFADGNGRVSRALTDRALAQADQTSVRFYALSAAIQNDKKGYYQILENTQKGLTDSQKVNALDVTDWLEWFLKALIEALQKGISRIRKVLLKARFWQVHSQTVLSARQIKVLNRLLDAGETEFEEGIAARHYKSIAGVSKATATRDLADLLEKGCIRPLPGEGRNTKYEINFPS